MPFQMTTDTGAWQPVRVDITQVKDRAHERLQVTFKDSSIVCLRLPNSTDNILIVDKRNSTPAALENLYKELHSYATQSVWSRLRHVYLSVTPWNLWRFTDLGDYPEPWPNRRKGLTVEDVRRDAEITIDLAFNYLHLRSPAVGMPLGARIAMPGDRPINGLPIAEGKNIVAIESIVVD